MGELVSTYSDAWDAETDLVGAGRAGDVAPIEVLIAAAMRTLPARWRTVLWHGDVMGLPPREIAPILEIEANAVSSLLFRARAGLRAAYALQTRSAPEPEGQRLIRGAR
jgi:DNA-directed RNA polymerase specialized sigma24 family protein